MKRILFSSFAFCSSFVFQAAAQTPPVETSVPEPPKSTAKPPIDLSGYLQIQYEHHQDSEDRLGPGGGVLNQDRFLVRRARFKAQNEGEYSSFMLELDGNTRSGPTLRLYRAEASLFYRHEPNAKNPLVKLTAGVTDVPFGYETTESSRARFFMERSRAARAFFPSPPDLGLKLTGEYRFLRYALAVQNGEPFGVRNGFTMQDPNAAKDVVGRLGAFGELAPGFEVSGGVSGLTGKGFHKGRDATEDSVAWEDANGDGQIQDGELQGIPGSAATPSRNFDRWLVGADLQLRLKTKFGRTTLYGEVQAGSNMDRGSFVADPIAAGGNVRELGYYVGLLQEVTPYGIIGFRYDHYAPDAEIFGGSGNRLGASAAGIDTFSPMAALVLPRRARLVVQYDIVRDRMATNAAGLPTDAKNDVLTVRLQVEAP